MKMLLTLLIITVGCMTTGCTEVEFAGGVAAVLAATTEATRQLNTEMRTSMVAAMESKIALDGAVEIADGFVLIEPETIEVWEKTRSKFGNNPLSWATGLSVLATAVFGTKLYDSRKKL